MLWPSVVEGHVCFSVAGVRQTMTPIQPASATRAPEISHPLGALQSLLLGRRPRAAILLIAALALLLSLALHIQVIMTSSGVWSDIHAYSIQANSVFQHQNVYDVTDRYPYPPVWIWIIALARWVAVLTGVRFDFVARAPGAIADLALAGLLLRYAWRRWGSCWFTLIPMLLFALNPLAILISAGHGQFDALVIFFLLLAMYLWGAKQDQRIIWGALAIGMAIALKGYPVLALPYFALMAPRGSRLLLVGVAFVPLVVSILIYCALFGVSPHMLSNVLGYQSTPDFGWGFLLAPVLPPGSIGQVVLGDISRVGIVVFAVVVPALLFRGRPVVAMTALFAVFYALTSTMSVQYMFWILPFVCLAFPEWALVYTAAALFGAVSFYLRHFPAAVPSSRVWRILLAPFDVSRPAGVAAVIAVSALLALYVILRASVVPPAIRDRAPAWAWLRRVMAS